MPARVNHPISRGGSTFAMAGRAQLSDDIAKRKEKKHRNPLDTRQKWESKN